MIQEITMQEYITNLNSYLQNNDKVNLLVKSDEATILLGVDTYNNSSNLPIYNTHKFGGVIVNFPSDISICHIIKDNNDFGINFLKEFKIFLIGFIPNHKIEINCNDIIIDDKYKVCSYMSCITHNKIYTAIHISMEVNLELIKSICIKPMKKIPKGLSEYGISREEVIQFINNEIFGE